MNFTEQDKANLIDYLNLVATKANFNLNTQEIIKYFKLLNYMQKDLLPKIDNHILELKRVIQTENKGEE